MSEMTLANGVERILKERVPGVTKVVAVHEEGCANGGTGAMANCWERRGCDEEMMSRCPHNTPGEPCPADCHYAACDRPTHVVATDFAVLLNPERYFDAAVKEVCGFCEHFLEHGPDIADAPEDGPRAGNPNRFLL